jgi:predicted nucleotidyltransferase
MLELQDCINKLAGFKSAFAQKFGITKLGIFGSVARKENTEVILTSWSKCRSHLCS